MATVTFELHGADDLIRQFERLAEAARGRLLLRAAVAGALVMVNDAKRRAPYRTGNLRRSIHVGGEMTALAIAGTASGSALGSALVSPTAVEVPFGTNVSYARDVEFGTGPHVIVPVRRKALWWKGARHPVPKVRHPGTRPHPFLRPAIDENRQAVAAEIADTLRDLLRAAP